MASAEFIDCPKWISDYEEIHHLLSKFIDKLDKGSRLLLRLSEKSIPTLFDYNNPDAKTIWSLIQKLETEYQILTIETEKPTPDKEIYDNAKIRFQREAENLVRHWLNRPKVISYKTEWQAAVNDINWRLSTNKSYINDHPLSYGEQAAKELVIRLHQVELSIEEPATLRALSAIHFWGDSKFLDTKADYIENAFPQNRIQTRPLLVNIYIPENFTSILFIENQDTFLMLASKLSDNSVVAFNASPIRLNETALIYTAGFRGTASRIRDHENYIFSVLSQTSPQALNRLTQWWEHKSIEQLPTYFWGDLDYSGLGILSALRETFEDMTAWKPGYQIMLKYHENRISHPSASGSKGTQKDPGKTDCPYADEVLLPAIRAEERFVDQEIVTFSELCEKYY